MTYYSDGIDSHEEDCRPLEREFSLSIGWKLVILIGSPILIGLFVWFELFLIREHRDNFVLIFFLSVGIAMTVILLLAMAEAIKSKLIITKDKIIKINVFGIIEYKLDEIGGFRSDQNYIFIYPLDETRKKIKVSRYFQDTGLLLEWLEAYFHNLDYQDYLREEEEILENKEYGYTEEQRSELLHKTKRRMRVINIISFIAALLLMFYGYTYEVLELINGILPVDNSSVYTGLTILNMILPLAGILLIAGSKGLIRLNETMKSPYPSVISLMIFPPLAIMMRVLNDYNLYDYDKLWYPAIVVSIVILMIILKVAYKDFQFKKKIWAWVVYPSLAAFILLYTSFTILDINCVFDKSPATVYQVKILKKSITTSSKSGNTYYLHMDNFGPKNEKVQLTVTKGYYYKVDENETIDIYFRKGLVDISWISLER